MCGGRDWEWGWGDGTCSSRIALQQHWPRLGRGEEEKGVAFHAGLTIRAIGWAS